MGSSNSVCLAALRCQYFCRFSNGAWALNGRMFTDTPEVSQMVFLYALEACLVNLELPYLSVRMSKGNFGRQESFRWLFSSHPKVLLVTLMGPGESNRSILILKCENITFENRS